jgi:hypothetical protein
VADREDLEKDRLFAAIVVSSLELLARMGDRLNTVEARITELGKLQMTAEQSADLADLVFFFLKGKDYPHITTRISNWED